MIYTPTRIAIPATSNFKRVPPRDPKDRQENYLERFDFTTIFSDVFVQDGHVWMVGPPFLNLERELKGSTSEWDAEDVSSHVEFESFKRTSRASFPVDSPNGQLKITGPLGAWEINVSSAPDFAFADSNLLVTQQQDNRLEWIAYWALFNERVNGVDSVVVYDNLSEPNYPESTTDGPDRLVVPRRMGAWAGGSCRTGGYAFRTEAGLQVLAYSDWHRSAAPIA